MAAGETLIIERRGIPIGFFVPVNAKDRRAGRKALGRLGGLLDDVMVGTDLDEDELVREIAGGRRSR
jgi:hypothetical protein